MKKRTTGTNQVIEITSESESVPSEIITMGEEYDITIQNSYEPEEPHHHRYLPVTSHV